MFSRIFLVVLLWSQPASLYAEPIKHLTLREIVVTGEPMTEPMATVVGVKTIEKGKNINLPDVLKDEADIDITRRAGIGDTADILAIRGLSGNRIMLNINDRPVNSAGVVGAYYIDWGTIPLDNIERIEIIKGGSSVQYGNNALGGVINVITKRPTERPTLTLFTNCGGGSGINSIQNYRLTHTYKIGPVGYSLAGSFQKADPFLWNNDFQGRNVAASFYIDLPLEGELTLGFQYAHAERGFIRNNRLSTDPDHLDFYVKKDKDYPLAFGETFSPYYGNAFDPGPGAYWDKSKYYLDFGYSQPVGEALLELKIYKNYEDRKEKNYSANHIDPSYADGMLVVDRKVESDRSYGGSFDLTKPFGDHKLLIGVEQKVLSYGDTDNLYIDKYYNNPYWLVPDSLLSFKPSSEGVCWGYYAQDTWQGSDHLALTGGLRFDRYENKSINGSTAPELDDEALTPKLAGTFQITDADTFTAAIYQALRTPGLPETYWWAEGATRGSPALKPEKNNAMEIVYQHKFSKSGFLRCSAYYYRVSDFIMFRFDPSWQGVYNIDRAVLGGASIDGRSVFNSWLSGNVSVTWQKTKKQGDIYDAAGLSDEIDYLPKWKASVRTEFKLPYRSVFNMTMRYIGERQTMYAYSSGWPTQQHFKPEKLDPYFTTDISLNVPVTAYGEGSLYVENLLDEDYEEQFGYPMTGIIAGVSLKLTF